MQVKKSSIFLVGLCAAVSAHAQINPSLLTYTNDGAGTDVQSDIYGLGLTSSVGSGSNYGDQVAGRVFQSTGATMTWNIGYQHTYYAADEKVGYYSLSSPAAITWVIGGSNTGLTSSAAVNIKGDFGLVLDVEQAAGPGTNTLIYGDPTRNSGGQNQLAVLNAVGPKASPNELLASWEDNINFFTSPQLNDYNDLGMTMTNTKAVPEPSSMAALAIAGLFGFGRSRRKRLAA